MKTINLNGEDYVLLKDVKESKKSKMQEVLEDNPKLIADSEFRLNQFQEEKEKIDIEIKNIETLEQEKIMELAELDESKKYSSEAKRKIALVFALKQNNTYLQLVKDSDSLNKTIKKMLIDIDFYKRQFRSVEALLLIEGRK